MRMLRIGKSRQPARVEDVGSNLAGLARHTRADVHVEIRLPVFAGGDIALQVLLIDGGGLLPHHLRDLLQLLGGEGVEILAVLVGLVLGVFQGGILQQPFAVHFGLLAAVVAALASLVVAGRFVLLAILFSFGDLPLLGLSTSIGCIFSLKRLVFSTFGRLFYRVSRFGIFSSSMISMSIIIVSHSKKFKPQRYTFFG